MKRYVFVVIFVIFQSVVYGQYKVNGTVISDDKKPIQKVEVYNESGGLLAKTDATGKFQFETNQQQIALVFYAENYKVKNVILSKDNYQNKSITLNVFTEQLSEIQVTSRKEKVFALKRLKDVEGTAIYAGKKTEVVLVNQSAAALSTNNARQIFNQVAGLNIYQNDDAGLQLNIGGRGLDPNRTANFNTRQNGYDISADVLGYPESYYTPASEGLDEIQVIRGAASLQYGTQFGGLINFVMKKPNPNKELEIITRNTVGSFGLYTNFTSVSGTKNKLSYYGYFNYKKGDGFRPNSVFDSDNIFLHLAYQFTEKTKLEAEITYLNYLAQQAGGLTDTMFSSDALQSNRTRNWFEVNWLLYNIKFAHNFTESTSFTFNFFGLDASRKAVGYRGDFRNLQLNPIIVEDTFFDGSYDLRDLIIGNFKNFGFETRLLSNYKAFDTENIFLIGAKYYKANNDERQGAGSRGTDADFNFVSSDEYITSNFDLPNHNVAVFGENIIKFSDKFSVTPGFRYEFIKTAANGTYTSINRDGAGNVINNATFTDDRVNDRNFGLLGLGLSYKMNTNIELYANASQNYRSVTFSDIRTVNPTFIVDENITDENGQTVDFGVRGKWKKYLNYDISGYGLFYNDRIGVILESEGEFKGDRLRTNIGDANIFGIESLFEWNLSSILNFDSNNIRLKFFHNVALTTSEYKNSSKSGVQGNKVEFIPTLNLKTGLKFAYKNLMTSIQFSHLSDQFTDASNALADEQNASREGIIGKVPAYNILDFSASYKYKFLKLEVGVNNLLNNNYFTRRATGYPGPGIIPSAPRNYYTTLQISI